MRARIAELETLVEARTRTRSCRWRPRSPSCRSTEHSAAIGKLRDAERQIEALHNTKLYRYAAVRRFRYATLPGVPVQAAEQQLVRAARSAAWPRSRDQQRTLRESLGDLAERSPRNPWLGFCQESGQQQS